MDEYFRRVSEMLDLGFFVGLGLMAAVLYGVYRLSLKWKKPVQLSTRGPLVCPFCAIKVADDVMYAGQSVHCPNCHSAFVSPDRIGPNLDQFTPVVSLIGALAVIGVCIWVLSSL